MEKTGTRKNILIAQIGKGTYIETRYAILQEGKETPEACRISRSTDPTGYTFEAVLNEIQKVKKVKIDTVELIGTATSYWGSVCEYYMDKRQEHLDAEKESCKELCRLLGEGIPLKTEKTLKKTEYEIPGIDTDDSVRERVEEVLTGLIRKKTDSDINVRIIILKKGIARNEIIENFDLLQAGMERAVEEFGFSRTSEETPQIGIYLDISNGFRSLPTYIYSFLSYLTRIRGEDYRMYMYYGMFEAKAGYEGRGAEYAPLVELDEVTDLMQWINAVNEFHNMGAVTELIRIFEDPGHKEWNLPVTDRRYREQYKDLKTVFKMFEYASNAHNLKTLEETIDILISLENLDKMPGHEALPRQARLMLREIAEDFRTRFTENNIPEKFRRRFRYSNLTLRLAEWFYDQRRIGSAAIAVMEGITTYLMERFCDPCSNGKYNMAIIEKYSLREPVKQVLMDSVQNAENRQEDTDNWKNVAEAYDSIRKNIRNIGAHILYEDTAPGKVNEYEEHVRNVLDIMFQDMRKEDRDSVFGFLKENLTAKYAEAQRREKYKADRAAAGKEKLPKVFINCSNHPSSEWSDEQKKAAGRDGKVEIVDILFPEVDPQWGQKKIRSKAEEVCKKIYRYNIDRVMCQGEFTLSYQIIRELKGNGINVVAACSRRETKECRKADGTTEKKTVFRFEKFRRY